MKIFLTSFFALFLVTTTMAGTFSIDNVSQQEIDALTEELGADWIFTTNSSAKPAGDMLPLVGIEVGVVIGVTDSFLLKINIAYDLVDVFLAKYSVIP